MEREYCLRFVSWDLGYQQLPLPAIVLWATLKQKALYVVVIYVTTKKQENIILLHNRCQVVTLNKFYMILAVPDHALLWLSLDKWESKKKESTRFEYV